MRRVDLIGQRFGRLCVVEYAGSTKDGQAQWRCVCDCGCITVVRGKDLRRGNTLSCGCIQKSVAAQQHTTHGISNTRIYRIWSLMRMRCYNPNAPQYDDWGGRGITICDEWRHDAKAFYDWSINHGYADDLSIDRIDNDKGYSPDNCRWVDRNVQSNNKRSNHLITHDGKTQTIAEWAAELGLNYDTLYSRIVKYKWDIHKALTTP